MDIFFMFWKWELNVSHNFLGLFIIRLILTKKIWIFCLTAFDIRIIFKKLKIFLNKEIWNFAYDFAVK